MTDARAGKKGDGPLDEFLAAAEAFVRNVYAAQVKAAGNHPDAVLIEGMSRVLVAQFGRVCEGLRTAYRDSGGAARRDADAALALQEGALLARVGEEIASAAMAAGPGGGFFGWLSQHLEQIKKLLRLLIQATHGGVIPPWWEKTLDVIDEIANANNVMFAGVLGFNRREVADEISARYIHTMNELAALERLCAAGRPKQSENGD